MGTLKLDQSLVNARVVDASGGAQIAGTEWNTQTFEPSISANLTKVHVAVSKNGSPSNLECAIRATDGSTPPKPTGSDLATATVTAASITALTANGQAQIVTFTFGSPPALTSGTRYAIILRQVSDGGDASNAYKWRGGKANSGSADYYGPGTSGVSFDSSSTWIMRNISDLAFVTEMDAAVDTPGLDQFAMGAIFGSAPLDRLDSSTEFIAQTFKPSVSAQLQKLRFNITRDGSQTGGSLTIEIQGTDGSGKPDGSALASESLADASIIDNALIVSNNILNEITFSSPPSLTAGTTYAIVIKSVNLSTHYFIPNTEQFNQYADGKAWRSANSGSTWNDNAGDSNIPEDIEFATLMLEPTETTQTINADAVVQLTTSEVISSDAFIGQETIQTLDADAAIAATVEQTINADAFVGQETSKTIDADAVVEATTSQTLNTDATIQATTTQTIDADANVQGTTTQILPANATISIETTQILTADAQIIVNQPDLKIFASTNPTVEVGTVSNPIVFSGVLAGEDFSHPDNPFFLFNDKDGSNDSVDAKNITIRVVALNVEDELVGQSSGAVDQQFTVAFAPVIDDELADHPVIVKVNGVIWSRVGTFSGAGGTDEIYTFANGTGTVTFGDDIEGKIPPLGDTIEVSYTPDQVEFGTEIEELNWLGVQSTGVVANDRTVLLERQQSSDANTVQAAHTPMTAVTGVFLNSDPNRLGTNFFPGGTFDPDTGIITLGSSLPGATEDVLIDYTYEIEDDIEPEFTQVGQSTGHTFINPIPSKNAKKINLQISAPAETSPSGVMNLKFKIRIDLKA